MFRTAVYTSSSCTSLCAAGQLATACRYTPWPFRIGGKLARKSSRSINMAAFDATPVTINGKTYRSVKEGRATILAPYQKVSETGEKVVSKSGRPRNNDEGDQAVFYNPIQQYNRDLSVLAILIYGESAVAIKKAKGKRSLAKNQRKKRKGDEKVKQDGVVETTEMTSTIPPSRKRSADEANLDVPAHDLHAKRSRQDDDVVDGENLAVEELNSTTTNGDLPRKEQNDDGLSANDTAANAASSKPRKTPFTILDALSASGLRAIRYAKEIPFATKIVANDMLHEAVNAIKLNIEHNELEDKVFPNVGDACQYMYSKTGNEAVQQGPSYVHKFDVVDLDPYGTAAPFLDAAIQSLTDGGMLCVTCTDAGVWASNGYPEKAFALYDGTTIKGPQSHEGGLRLILHAVVTSAAKYGISVEPLLSLSIDFYARLFIRIHKSQQEVKCLAGTTMMVYNCDQGCGAWQTQLLARNQMMTSKSGDAYFKHGYSQGPSAAPHCEHCGTKTHLGGPMWAGPLHNPAFVQKILDRLPTLDKDVYGTIDRVRGMLTMALEEEDLEWPSLNKPTVLNGTSTHASAHNDTTKGTSTDATVTTIVPRLPTELLSPAPFFFIPTYLARTLSIMTPSEDPFRGAFLALGYKCTRSHCKPGSFKTNAPWKVIWEIAREWIRHKDPGRIPRLLGEGEFEDKRSVKKTSAGYTILKRLRGRNGDTLAVAKTKDLLLQKLGNGPNAVDIETLSDLQDVLKSTLHDLEHAAVRNAIPEAMNGGNDQASGENTGISKDAVAKISGKALIDGGGDPSELQIVFDEELGKAFRDSKGDKLVRYQANPRAHWGPMNRAGTK